MNLPIVSFFTSSLPHILLPLLWNLTNADLSPWTMFSTVPPMFHVHIFGSWPPTRSPTYSLGSAGLSFPPCILSDLILSLASTISSVLGSSTSAGSFGSLQFLRKKSW